MTPTFRTAGKPAFRNASLAALLFSASALAGCAGHIPPPEISYDDAAPAVQTVDPPAPVRVVALPQPLPLPGQLKPVGKDGKPEPVSYTHLDVYKRQDRTLLDKTQEFASRPADIATHQQHVVGRFEVRDFDHHPRQPGTEDARLVRGNRHAGTETHICIDILEGWPAAVS